MANSGLDETTLKAAMLLQICSANAKAREAAVANAVEPRAESAYYEQSSDKPNGMLRQRIIINLKSGATYSFPPVLAQGLAGASPEDLAEVEVTPSGDALHWEKFDKARVSMKEEAIAHSSLPYDFLKY